MISRAASLCLKSPFLCSIQNRGFYLHEYQSKEIMREVGINVQKGGLALTPTEAKEIGSTLSAKHGLILKAQVHAGGRGKGVLTSGLKGGVKVCSTTDELYNYTSDMIGYNLITKQTKKEGLPVNAVLVHEGVTFDKQIYLAILYDRALNGPVVISSKEGNPKKPLQISNPIKAAWKSKKSHPKNPKQS